MPTYISVKCEHQRPVWPRLRGPGCGHPQRSCQHFSLGNRVLVGLCCLQSAGRTARVAECLAYIYIRKLREASPGLAPSAWCWAWTTPGMRQVFLVGHSRSGRCEPSAVHRQARADSGFPCQHIYPRNESSSAWFEAVYVALGVDTLSNRASIPAWAIAFW